MNDVWLPPSARLRLRVARGLEEGAWDGPLARVVARAWEVIGARSLARPLVWGEDVRVVAVGGATLGGSGKTPLAIACARALAASGAPVALVAHGYRARAGEARVVREDDDAKEVGDEAILAARALLGVARVIVAGRRREALSYASTFADLVVLDGVLQTAPKRAALSLLALDGESPWGAGQVVPRGDLRAAKGALLAASDAAVLLHDEMSSPVAPLVPGPVLPAFLSARVRSRGAYVSGELVPWPALLPLRVGLFIALARPARLLAFLARRGLTPHHVVQVADHGLPPEALARSFASPRVVSHSSLPSGSCTVDAVDLWLASPKCAIHLERAKIPHAVLEHEVELGEGLLARLRGVVRGPLPLSPHSSAQAAHLHPPATLAP